MGSPTTTFKFERCLSQTMLAVLSLVEFVLLKPLSLSLNSARRMRFFLPRHKRIAWIGYQAAPLRPPVVIQEPIYIEREQFLLQSIWNTVNGNELPKAMRHCTILHSSVSIVCSHSVIIILIELSRSALVN